MPSQLHEALLLLFRNRPELAPELLRDVMHMNQARADPELAVLSAMVHGQDTNTAKAVQIALMARCDRRTSPLGR